MRITLDQLEAERGDIEPFELDLGDTVVSLKHPSDMPFESLVNFDGTNPAAVLRSLMGDEAFDDMAGNARVTLGVLKSVLDKYYVHYGLASLGEGSASPRSASGSARPSKSTSRRRATA